MSMSEELYLNLTIHNDTRVNNLITTGNLDVDLTKLHVQNHGTFVSNLPGDVQFTLVIHTAGDSVELYTTDGNGASIYVANLFFNDIARIRYSDMHYAHALDAQYSYRFLSDMDTILLTQISD